MAQFGTHEVSDALAPLVGNFQTVVDFGIENAYEQINAENTAYNASVTAEMDERCEIGEEETRVFGGADEFAVQEGDEFSNPDAQKVEGGYPIQFPMRRHEQKVAWTYDFSRTNSVDKLAASYVAARTADVRWMQRQMRLALYYPFSRPARLPDGTDNPNAFKEFLNSPKIKKSLYPLLNADGMPVPVGPNGETFDPATHTHYMASDWTAAGSTAATRDGDMQAAVLNLVEHGLDQGSRLCIEINMLDAGQFVALPNFVAAAPIGVQLGDNTAFAIGSQLDPRNYNNRFLGTYLGFEVWTKPWVFPNYKTITSLGTRKTLYWRKQKGGLNGDFELVFTNPSYKLLSDIMRRDGGCSVQNRETGVVLYTGGPVFQTPNGLI